MSAVERGRFSDQRAARQFSDLDAAAQHRRLPLGKVKKARRRLTLADQNFAALRRNPVSLVDQVARRRRPQSREMLAAQRLFLGRKTHLRPAQPQARQYAAIDRQYREHEQTINEVGFPKERQRPRDRSEAHPSELQSLMRTPYVVLFMKKHIKYKQT